MKKILSYFTGLLILLSCYGCPYMYEDDDWIEETSAYSPIYMNRNELNTSVVLSTPRTIIESGKIYIKDDILFIGEKYEGFHVFDNSDPANPINIAFISVPGATDIAIKNDVMYVNNAIDLVAFTINANTTNITITKRIQNTFPQLISPDGFEFYVPDDKIIVNWQLNN